MAPLPWHAVAPKEAVLHAVGGRIGKLGRGKRKDFPLPLHKPIDQQWVLDICQLFSPRGQRDRVGWHQMAQHLRRVTWDGYYHLPLLCLLMAQFCPVTPFPTQLCPPCQLILCWDFLAPPLCMGSSSLPPAIFSKHLATCFWKVVYGGWNMCSADRMLQ